MKPFFLQDSLKFDLGLYILEAGNSERCVIGYDGVFWETLRRLRIERQLSQQQLADRLHVERPSVTNWEGGRRLPDAAMITAIARVLDVDAAALLSKSEEPGEVPNVLLVDDERIILEGGILVLREALPDANVVGFTKPSQALEFGRKNPVALGILRI